MEPFEIAAISFSVWRTDVLADIRKGQMVGTVRFELTVSWSQARRDNQTTLRPNKWSSLNESHVRVHFVRVAVSC